MTGESERRPWDSTPPAAIGRRLGPWPPFRQDAARYRQFQEGMARMTAWMGALDASVERVAAFTRANREAGERMGRVFRALGGAPRG